MERQATYTGDELRRLTDRRIELYGQIDKDMTALEGYCLESLYTARRVLEVVVNVLGHRFMDSEGWLGKGPIERLLVRVLEAVTTGAEDEARTKWRAVHTVPVQGNMA